MYVDTVYDDNTAEVTDVALYQRNLPVTFTHTKIAGVFVCVCACVYLEPLVNALEVENMLTRKFTNSLSIHKLAHADHTRCMATPTIVVPTNRLHRRRRCVVLIGCRRRELERSEAVDVRLRHSLWFGLAQLTSETQ